METKIQLKPEAPFESSYIIGGDVWTKTTCEVRPFGNNVIVINLTKTPNVFYRIMMRLFFGFRFKVLKNE
jgi:hypothetical protein